MATRKQHKIFMTAEWQVPRHALENDSLFDLWVDKMRSNWYLAQEGALGNSDGDVLPEIIIDGYGAYASSYDPNDEGAGYCRLRVFRAAMDELSNAMAELGINDAITVRVENVVRDNAMESIGNNGYFTDTNYKNPSSQMDLVTESIWLVGPKGVGCFEAFVRNFDDLDKAMQKALSKVCDLEKESASPKP